MQVFGDTCAAPAVPDAFEHVYLNRKTIFSAQTGLKAFAPLFSDGLLHRNDYDHRAHRRVMQAAMASRRPAPDGAAGHC